jgi:hypothetical protein
MPPDAERLGPRLIDARLHLLDRQVMDLHADPVTVVDDVELSDPSPGALPAGAPPPVVTALLSGAFRFTRIFGGRPPMSRLDRIDWAQLTTIGTALTLRGPRESYPVGWIERWVARHVIGRIPGGRHDPE